MAKKQKTQDSILNIVSSHPGLSSVEIGSKLGVTRITIYTNLQELIQKNLVYSKGRGKLTRYFQSEDGYTTFQTPEFYELVKKRLEEEYEGVEELNLISFSKSFIANLSADGIWTYGLGAFNEKIKKENNNMYPSNDLLGDRFTDFMSGFIEQEQKRRKNNLFSGTQSLKTVLQRHEMEISIDALYFCELFSLVNFSSIGRLRCAEEIYWGKKSQDKRLLESGIHLGIDRMVSYIEAKKISYAIFTPPTLPRSTQFPNVLRSILSKKGYRFHEIIARKNSSPQITYKPQKDTSGKDRIINARVSIVVEPIAQYIDVEEIVIFDDNFTTGATVNAIAEKMREQGFKGKITAITLTGSFDYIPGVTDIGEI